MKKVKVYQYGNCSTCQKALKYLTAKGIAFEAISIVDRPPSEAELKEMLGHLKGELRKLFNTSGQLYREMNMTAKLAKLTEGEALKLLAKHGKLIKRPFLLTSKGGTVGFDEAHWKTLL